MNNPPIAILSSPRSGNHFIRYIVEFLSGRCTLGVTRKLEEPKDSGQKWEDGSPILEGDSPVCLRPNVQLLDHVSCDNPIAAKYHFADPKGRKNLFPIANTFEDISNCEKLIYIQREPLDNLISMYNNEIWPSKDGEGQSNIYVAKNLSEEPGPMTALKNSADGCWENLQFFKNFKGPKLMIMYEMIVYGDHTFPVQELAKLINCTPESYSKLVNDFEKYRQDSMEAPHRPPLTLKKHKKDGDKGSRIKNGFKGAFAHRRNLLAVNHNSYHTLAGLISPMLNDPLIKQLYNSVLEAHDLGTPAVAS